MSFLTDLFKKTDHCVAVLDAQSSHWHWLLCHFENHQLICDFQKIDQVPFDNTMMSTRVYDMGKMAQKHVSWVLGVHDKHVVSAQIELPARMSQEMIKACVEQAIEEQVQMPIEQWHYDYHRERPTVWCPKSQTIHWAAIPAWLIDQTMSDLNQFSQSVEGVYPLSQATKALIQRWIQRGDIQAQERVLVHLCHDSGDYMYAIIDGQVQSLSALFLTASLPTSVKDTMAGIQNWFIQQTGHPLDRVIMAGDCDHNQRLDWTWPCPVHPANLMEVDLNHDRPVSSHWAFAVGLAYLQGRPR